MTDISRLPVPLSQTWEWQRKGACRVGEPGVFFHPYGERGPRRVRREARAKAICAGCAVLLACREWALGTEETYGVWGGLGEAEREEILARASRARRGLPETAA